MKTLICDGRPSITSDMDDDKAIRLVEEVGQGGSEFARSLSDQWHVRGLSSKQWYWVHKIANDEMERRKPKPLFDRTPQPNPNVIHLGHDVFAALGRMFGKASESGLQYPKIRFAFGDIHIKMTVASYRAKVPGSINVVNLDDRNLWYGRIVKGDDFEKGRDCTDAVVEFLKKFSADPVGEAAAYGKTTGNCCFCHKELTHQSSIEWGYGPRCAEKWGLPHRYEDVTRPDVEVAVRKGKSRKEHDSDGDED